MNPQRKTYAAQLYRQYHTADQTQTDRLNRWRSIEPESAELLALQVLAKQAQRLLEIGTSGGYSTIWLADAAEHTGGKLTTLDIDATRQQTASHHLATLNLQCEVLCQDAGTFLQNNQTLYDFILLDAERPAYPGYWQNLKRALAQSGSLLVVDNVLSHAEQVADFIELVRQSEDFEHTILPIGAGLLFVVKK